MKEWVKAKWAWVRQDWRRFGWEVLNVAFFAGVSWGVTAFLNSRTNQVCLDEKEAMRQQWQIQQAQIDLVEYETTLADKEDEISEYRAEIDKLREKVASDSIAHLSELQAVRAINGYIKNGRPIQAGR